MHCVKCQSKTLRKTKNVPVCRDCTPKIYEERDEWHRHIEATGVEKNATKEHVSIMKKKISSRFIVNMYSMGVNVSQQLVTMRENQEKRAKEARQKEDEKIAKEHNYRGLDKDD